MNTILDPNFYRNQGSIGSAGTRYSRSSLSSARSSRSGRGWRRSHPLSVISEETISQLGSDIEYDPERFDLRTDVFWQLSSIQWITGLVYSIIINACIIAVTTVGLVYHWPFSSDAMSGFVCGMMGLVAGIILGYVAAKVTFLVVVTKKLRAQCEELGVPI